MASQITKKETQLLMRAAGGGRPSEETGFKTISSFPRGGPVLEELRNVYKRLTQGQPFQDLPSVSDEESFLSYMSSAKSAATAPPLAASRDLSYPLSSYYISSSHNTYLSGHQLYGEASTEAYTNVLERGCRCLEIDVWDGEGSDTSASSSDDELHRHVSKTSIKEKPKPSRWSKMKAKAVHIRGSSPSRNWAGRPSLVSPTPNASDGLPPPALPEPQFLKTEPRVLHGYTFTQSIPFRAVCQTIRESAFTASDLPLIISLEVHANLDQQQTMVDIMKETWKDFLIDPTTVPKGGLEELPSLQSMRKKILIKVKWKPNSKTGESNDPADQVASSLTETSSDVGADQTPADQKKAFKILQTLSELGVYTRAYTFKQWNQPEASIPTHVFSLSEGKVHAMFADPMHGPALFEHNRNFMMRVFPRGTRIRSSNVDPTFHWRQGAQMVALNWQNLDKGMMLNEGMFAGQQGWVLKPVGYRLEPSLDTSKSTNTGKKPPHPIKKRLDLKIQLLSGQDIPLPIEKESSHRKIKPYVQIELHVDTHGPPGQGKAYEPATSRPGAYPEEDKEEKKYKFRSKTQKSESPNFEGETIAWSSIPDVVDELSFIRLKLKDDRSMAKDPMSSWACIRLDRLQTGLRFIHLLDASGLPSKGVLLVRISKVLS